MWNNLFTGNDLNVTDKLLMLLSQKNIINHTLVTARFIGDKMTITFIEEGVSYNHVICNSKFKETYTFRITLTITEATMDTFKAASFFTNVTIPVTTKKQKFIIRLFRDYLLHKII